MNQKIKLKLFGIVFAISTFLSGMHHHSDLKIHNDCQICVIQHNTTDIDTPNPHTYLTHLDMVSEPTLCYGVNISLYKAKINLSARSPPYLIS